MLIPSGLCRARRVIREPRRLSLPAERRCRASLGGSELAGEAACGKLFARLRSRGTAVRPASHPPFFKE
jgi:hypothetical protein